MGATTHVAEEANRSLVVELQCRLHLLALLATWYDECWVTTYLEEDFLVIGVLHVPDDVNLIAFQTIRNGKIDVIWIVLQGLLVVDEGKGETVGSLAYQLELCVTGEAMAREVIFGSVDAIGVVPHTANDREKDRRVAVPVLLVIHPISLGVISDYDMAAMMLRELISKVTSFSLFKPRVLLCVPSSITGVEERAIIDAAIEAGARKVYLLETAVATAIGAGVDISKPDGHMVIDIGGGTSEVAVVSMGGVVECESFPTAGDSFDEAIIRYIRKKHNVLIGSKTAEELKISIGGALPRPDAYEEEAKGRCLLTGLPKTVKVSSEELVEVLAEPTQLILDNIHSVLERTPPELVGDLGSNGIILSGSGSMRSAGAAA